MEHLVCFGGIPAVALLILLAGAGFFVKLIYLMWFRSIPSFGIVSFVNLEMSTFLRGITQTVPTIFRGIVSERNSVANLTRKRSRHNLCTLKWFSRRTHTSVMHLAPSLISSCSACAPVAPGSHHLVCLINTILPDYVLLEPPVYCICSGSPNGPMLGWSA